MTTKQRTPAAKFDDVPGDLPRGTVPENSDLNSIAKDALSKLNHLQKDDWTTDALWRDILSFTDTFRTLDSADVIVDTLQELSQKKHRSKFELSGRAGRTVSSVGSSWIDVDILFSVQDSGLTGQGAGIVSVAHQSDGSWKIWMLTTWLECWDGHGHPDQPVPMPNGAGPSALQNVQDEVYDAIVIGGGQAGLSASGRLQALGLKYVLFEAKASIGDVWGNRYDSLKWHTLKDFGSLPFGYTFPLEDEEMLPTKKIAKGHKAWSEKYGINVRTNTTVEKADWDSAAQNWIVTATTADVRSTWRAKNIVLSIGLGISTPKSPQWASPENIKASGFQGTIMHGSKYRNANGWAGKRGVVIGTANTGHDVAEDMANVGMETTMIQRGATFVLPGEWLLGGEAVDYNREKPIMTADREVFTYPLKIQREIVNRAISAGMAAQPEMFDALEKAGFKLDRHCDIWTNIYIRLGGHYVDIGASQRIINGEIKIESKEVKHLTKDGLQLEDGSELKADVIVVATGFNLNLREDTARMLGSEVADQMDDMFGISPEGEIRGNGRLAGHPQLYYFSGDTRQARFFSSFLALQIQKEKLGVPLRPYLDQAPIKN